LLKLSKGENARLPDRYGITARKMAEREAERLNAGITALTAIP
jgi:hypothetical protein